MEGGDWLMPNEIDRRVVEMQFENAQFERGVNQSLNTLDKLKAALNFKDTEKSLSEVQNTVSKGIDFSSISDGIQVVSSGFNALEQIAKGVFQHIGWDIAKSVTEWVSAINKVSFFGQAGAGWQKYGALTEATQTIVAAGYAIEDVEATLERLNWYTDETSYNFTDMANNIGKFTAQGVKLDTAATAMQGISNWAARSGQHIEEARRAMYNLSQSLAVGSVKLIDWKSIENANMATKEFKQTVIDTAVEMGTLNKSWNGVVRTAKKGTEVTAASFSSTLSEAWFTSDVLLSVLEKYGSATNELYEISQKTGLTATQMLQALKSYQNGTDEWKKILDRNGDGYTSAENFGKMLANLAREENKLGLESFRMAQEALTFKQAMDSVVDAASTTWMNVFNKLFGTFEDARNLWTNIANDLYDIFVEPVNDFLGFITKNFDSGFSQIESVIKGAGVNIDDFESALIEAAEESNIMGKAMKEALENGTMSFYDFFTNTELAARGWDLNLIDKAISKLTDGKFTKSAEEYLSVVSQVFAGNFGNGEARYKALADAGYDYELVQNLVNRTIREGKLSLEDLSEEELNSISINEEQIERLKELYDTESDVNEIFNEARSRLNQRSNRDLLAEGLHETLVGIGNTGATVRKILSEIFDGPATSFVSSMVENFNKLAIKFSNFTEELYDNNDIIGSIATTIDNILKIAGAAIDVFSPFWETAKTVINDLIDLFGALGKRIENIASEENKETGLLGFFLDLKDKIGPIAEFITNVLHTLITGITDLIDPETETSLSALGQVFENTFSVIWNAIKTVGPIFSGIGQFIKSAIDVIRNGIDEFLENKNISDVMSFLKQGFGVAIAAGIASIVKNIQGLTGKFGENGLLGLIFPSIGKNGENAGGESKGFLSGISKAISNFADTLSKSIKKIVDVEALKTFASAILVLAGALFVMSLIPAEKIMNSFNYLASGVAGVVLLMTTLSKLDTKQIAKMVAVGVAMTAMSAAILVLSAALVVLSLIPTENIENAVGALSGLLITIGVALALLSNVDSVGMLAAAAAMLIISPAILVLAAALGILALIPSEKIDSALSSLTGLLGNVSVALAGLSLIDPVGLLSAAAAMLIISPALLIMAAALGALALLPLDKVEGALGIISLALLELAGVLAGLSLAGPMVIVAAGAMLIMAAALIPLAAALGVLALVPSQQLAANLIILALALSAFVAAALTIAPVIGPLVAVIGTLALFGVAIGVLGVGLTGLSAGLTAFMGAVIVVAQTIITAIGQVISTVVGLVTTIFDVIAQILRYIVQGVESITQYLPETARNIIDGLIEGLLGGLASVFEAAASIGRTILNGVKSALGIHSPSQEMIDLMKYVGEGLEIGADNILGDVEESGENVGNKWLDSIRNQVDGANPFTGLDTNITPVFDMDSLTNGSLSFGAGLSADATEKLGEISVNMDAMSDRIAASIEQLGTHLISENQTSDQMITNAITQIRSDIYNLQNAISSMQITLDTGAIAGAVNRSLGRMYAG